VKLPELVSEQRVHHRPPTSVAPGFYPGCGADRLFPRPRFGTQTWRVPIVCDGLLGAGGGDGNAALHRLAIHAAFSGMHPAGPTRLGQPATDVARGFYPRLMACGLLAGPEYASRMRRVTVIPDGLPRTEAEIEAARYMAYRPPRTARAVADYREWSTAKPRSMESDTWPSG